MTPSSRAGDGREGGGTPSQPLLPAPRPLGASLALAFRLALRELRGGPRGFGVFLACLALGVAVIAAIGSLSASVDRAVSADARALLGGDLEISQSQQPLAPEVADFLAGLGAVSEVAHMRAMVRSEDGRPVLVELKAVDPAYPLYGEARVEDGQGRAVPLAEALAERDGLPGVAVEQPLLDRLNVRVGDTALLGEARVRIGGVVTREPDASLSLFSLGPRLLIGLGDLGKTGLLQPGSVVRYHYRVRLERSSPAEATRALKEAFPDGTWRVRDYAKASPGIGSSVDRMAMYLTLVGLTAMLTGGIGVANAVRAHLAGRMASIAAMKCLGAERRLVVAANLIQVMLLASAGVAVGVVAGAFATPILLSLLAAYLPRAVSAGIEPWPLLLASAYGLLTALAFSIRPLSAAAAVRPASLFRGHAASEAGRPGPGARLTALGAGAALALLTILTSARPRVGLGFAAGAVATFVLFRLLARLVVRLAGRIRPADPRLRLGLSAVGRPGTGAAGVVFSLGLGLTVMAAVALIDGNLRRSVEEQIPSHAPSFFFIDIQADAIDAFRQTLSAVPGVTDIESQPSLRGRITRIGGIPAEEAHVSKDSEWALRSDRGLTFAAAPPPGTRITEGRWWPPDYAGPPLISLDEAVAKGFGIGVGDTLAVSVLGREITARIASLRDIDWASLSINHTIVFSPGVLDAAPHSFIATARVPRDEEETVYKAVAQSFPGVSAINIRDVLERIAALLGTVGLAVRATAAVTLLAGLLVLSEALRANLRGRYHDAVVLKVVGATRRDILLSLAAEYAYLGLCTAVLAVILGSAASYAFVTRVLYLDWEFLPGAAAGTVAVGVLVTVALGLTGVYRVLGRTAWPVLRNE